MKSREMKIAAIKKLTKEYKGRLTEDEILGFLILGGLVFKSNELSISEVDLMIKLS